MHGASFLTGMIKLGSCLAAAALVALRAPDVNPPVHPVEHLDTARYAGLWYEVARTPNALQSVCEGDVTATYRPLDDGSLAFVQRCKEADRKWLRITGRVSLNAEDESHARMALSFLPSWLRWWPGSSAPHWVVMVGRDYDFAVVSEPARRHVWILSRAPFIGPATYSAIIRTLRDEQYPVDSLVATPQHVSPWEVLAHHVALLV